MILILSGVQSVLDICGSLETLVSQEIKTVVEWLRCTRREHTMGSISLILCLGSSRPGGLLVSSNPKEPLTGTQCQGSCRGSKHGAQGPGNRISKDSRKSGNVQTREQIPFPCDSKVSCQNTAGYTNVSQRRPNGCHQEGNISTAWARLTKNKDIFRSRVVCFHEGGSKQSLEMWVKAQQPAAKDAVDGTWGLDVTTEIPPKPKILGSVLQSQIKLFLFLWQGKL